MQPQLERRFQQLLGTTTDETATTEEIRPASLSTFNEDQAAFLHQVVQSDIKELTVPAPMDTTEPHKSHIHEMYEQSMQLKKTGPMFIDDSDEEQTPVKTTPSADKMEARHHQLEALTIPGFSQRLFDKTVSQPPPALELQVVT